MDVPKFKTVKITPSEFFSKLFQIRTQVHIRHLRITGKGSYAGHIALNDFYEKLLNLTDSLIESYQGKYGIINITVKECSDTEVLVLLKDLVKLTDGGEVYNLFKETWIQNQIDEISTLTYQTIYKLTNLS